MRKFSVTIQATITKNIIVEVDESTLEAGADAEDKAYELAHNLFSCECDGEEENYEEETKDISEIQ